MRFDVAVTGFAMSQIGQKERPGNSGWYDSVFMDRMIEVGWQMGQAWCAFFAELCWREPKWDGKREGELAALFSGSAVKTYNNFKNDTSGNYIVDKDPRLGSVVIWQNYRDGKAHWTGHAGIVVGVHLKYNYFEAVEGNTNSTGGREGIEVAFKKRKLDFRRPERGLRLLGFIRPDVDQT